VRALVPLADGVEELEAVAILDVLRRAGWEVTAAGVDEGPVRASRGVRLLADCGWSAGLAERAEAIVIPGGTGGTERLSRHEGVLAAVRRVHGAGGLVAAICAGPLVLQAAGVLAGRRATCHPAVAGRLTAATRRTERVVTDGNIVTSQGAGTAVEFALALVRHAEGPAKAAEVAAGMVAPRARG
jgi:4-methyl-5(b-hydroxyethyl)-thiazole monophosphate biosynthesis